MNVANIALLVDALATLAERMLQGTALLRQTRAENREPTDAELLELDILDDQARAAFQKKIDDRRAADQAANGTQKGDVPMKVAAVLKPAQK